MNKIIDFLKKFNIEVVPKYLTSDVKENLINDKYKGVLYNENIFYEENKQIVTYNIASNRKNYIEFKSILNTLFTENNINFKIKDSPISCFPNIPNPLATGSITIIN